MSKTLLCYPGGKSRAIKFIVPLFPDNIPTMASPFFGGGAIEIHMARQGTRVHGYDINKHLVHFWQHTLQHTPEMHRLVESHYPMDRDGFNHVKNKMKNNEFLTSTESAAAFYALNRRSYAGLTASGGYTPKTNRFTWSSIERLKNFTCDNLSVEFGYCWDTINKHQNDFLYCDPPYATSHGLYGIDGNYHNNFDHERLAKILNNRDGWVLSYNDCELIRDLYSNCEIMVGRWKYGMTKNKNGEELIIRRK